MLLFTLVCCGVLISTVDGRWFGTERVYIRITVRYNPDSSKPQYPPHNSQVTTSQYAMYDDDLSFI